MNRSQSNIIKEIASLANNTVMFFKFLSKVLIFIDACAELDSVFINKKIKCVDFLCRNS